MATLGDSTATKLKVLNDLDVVKIFAPTTSNGATHGAGTNGQVLTSNGTSSYWKTISITKSQISDLGTIGAAAAKAVDTSISASSSSANLPTSAAVAAFVEGKGYKTTDNNTTYSFSVNNGKLTITEN